MKRSCLTAFIALATMAMPQPQVSVYSIDTARSKIELHVLKAGVFKAFGHDHLIAAKHFSGSVRFNPSNLSESSVALSIDAKGLTVLDPGASESDKHDVQTTMESAQVLDVGAFPKITFTSSSISHVRKAAAGEWDISVAGSLELHGFSRPVTIPIHITFENTRLHAKGEALVQQTDFGIKPIKIGGGAVRVKDQVSISFDIIAEKS